MIYLIIVFAAISRFIPHMPNAAPVTALAIFAGAYLPKKQAVVIPLAARFISDVFLGFFSWPLMAAVYAAHLVGVLFGLWIRRSAGPRPAYEAAQGTVLQQGMGRWVRIFVSSLGASAIFFIVTNFAFLYPYYSHSISGIMAAYANGLPFFRGTLLGDLGYTLALFGSYEIVLYVRTAKRTSPIPA